MVERIRHWSLLTKNFNKVRVDVDIMHLDDNLITKVAQSFNDHLMAQQYK